MTQIENERPLPYRMIEASKNLEFEVLTQLFSLTSMLQYSLYIYIYIYTHTHITFEEGEFKSILLNVGEWLKNH